MTALPESFFHAIPKVELHCHLLGTVQRATLTEWVQRERAPISLEEIEAFYTRGEKPVGVLKVLRALEQQLMRHPDDLARLTREYLAAAAAHNVRYAEFFWNPTAAARPVGEGGKGGNGGKGAEGAEGGSGIAYADGLTAICEAIQTAESEHGIVGRLIPAIDREASPREALEMVQWVIEHRRDEVLGIGIDYKENDRPPEMFADAYAAARRGGLKTTAHAGEFGMPWTNVQTAVELLQVDRIDHGYTVAVDESPAARQFAQRCADRGLVFTVVPTNSYYMRTLPKARWALDHPIRRMPGLGLLVHPNTDDPTLHLVTPTQAWHKMHVDFCFDLQELRGFMRNGLAAAWIDDTTRRRWSPAFEAGFEAASTAAL
jgi:adenine deaminase